MDAIGLSIIWIFLTLVVSFAVGTQRTIGFFGAMLISLVFSPVIGLLFCGFFPTKEEEERQKELLKTQKAILEHLKNK